MKNLSKVTLGIVSLFSLCSCRGKGTEATKEEFAEVVNKIKTENKIAHAKLTYKQVKTTGIGSSEIKVMDKAKGEYFKDSSGKWLANSTSNDEIADLLFISTNRTMNPQSYISSIDETSESYIVSFKETYYIKPMGYEVSYKIDYSSNGNQFAIEDSYYEWNDYGYITFVSGTTTFKDKTTNENVEETSFELKITYRLSY